MSDLVLPAFALDCRDWFVLTPAEAGLPDDVDGSPVLAAFSSVIVDAAARDLLEITGALSVGLLDDETRAALEANRVAPGSVASRLPDELCDGDPQPEALRYVMPVPNASLGEQLALLAEFAVDDAVDLTMFEARVVALMASFSWQA